MDIPERRERIADALRKAGIARENEESTTALTQNAQTVLARRYLVKDQEGKPLEEPATMFERVADNLSQADLNYGATEAERQTTQEEFLDVMRRKDFMPNSPTLMNAGRELQQLSACFVIPVADSLEGIFSSVKKTALIHKSGGGTGFSFNNLRPSGDFVKSTGGIASGPASFIRAFDAATDVVKQGGTRRGANMGILNVDHPDVLQFIRMKNQEGALENFNISIAVTEEFMEMVRNGEDYPLTNPRTGEHAGSLHAPDVFNEIVENAWATGDPGLIFLDRINWENPNPHLGKIESTNPCVTGDTLVMTMEGPQRADSLVGTQQVLMVNGQPHLTGPEGFFSTGIKSTLRVNARDGRSLRMTHDHRVLHETQDHDGKRIQDWIQAGDLRTGMELVLHDHRDAHQAGKSILPMGKLSQPIVELLRESFTPEHAVINPEDRNPGICLAGMDPAELELIQSQLQYLGIQSRIAVTASSGDPELILQGQNLVRFTQQVGATNPRENFYLKQLEAITLEAGPGPEPGIPTTSVVSITDAGPQEVYDVQAPGINAFDANGFYVHNCGEQPLAPYESCNLGSVNLARMVRYGEQGAEVDWSKLEAVIRTGVHMLDNVIDMNEYPLVQIEEASKLSRRIGLGVMGWADLLIQLGIRYDSQEALDLATRIMKFIRERTHAASGKLAEARGDYPAWKESTYEKGENPVRMRNTAPVTIAPTGTISIIAGASSGIEPLFALAYERNIMDRTHMRELNPYFNAVALQEGIQTPEFMEQVALTGSLMGTNAPDWMKEVFRVSQDITPEWHVRMQAAFQEHTDNSVSKTINFPSSATREDVEQAYMLAYETGCKGITVYRDGSKSQQVLSTGQTTQTNGRHPAPRPRPREMEGITRLVRTGHGNMYTTINSDQDGKLFEVFTTVGKAGGCDSAQIEAISRLISLALRSDIDPQEIIRQLRGITCCPHWDEGVQVQSIPDGVALALENRLGHGRQQRLEAPALKRLCPECSAPISFLEGCEACTDPGCGWNHCS